MTDHTVSTLTAASALDGTELFYGVQGGADRKVTGAQIATLAGTGGSGMAIGNVVTDATTESVLFADTTSVATTRQIANRGCFLFQSTAGAGQANTQTYHFARDDITSIQIGWAGFYVDSSGVEHANTGTNTIKAALWYNGTAHQLLFSASATGTIPNGGYLISDALSVTIPAGAKFYIRSYNVFSVSQLTRFAATTTRDTANGDAVNHTASDQTMSGSVVDAGGAIAGLWPSLLLGSSTRPAILLIGDSRGSGEATDSYSDGAGHLGNMERSVGPSFATLNICRNTDAALAFASRTMTLTVFPYFTHVICDYGMNDAISGATGATILTRLQTIFAMFSGQKIFQTTYEPYTTSTDSWATVANQTVTASETARLVVNAAVRGGLANTEGYFDVASILESSLNSGFWKVPAYTTDGLHEDQFGYQQLALGEIIPVGAFVGSSVILAQDNPHFRYNVGSATLQADHVSVQSLSFAPGAVGDPGAILALSTANAVEHSRNIDYDQTISGAFSLQDGTTPVSLFAYNTTDGGANFEYGGLDWTFQSNVLSIGTINGAGGTGTVRETRYYCGGRLALYTVKTVNGDNWYVGQSGSTAGTGARNVGFGDNALTALTTGEDNFALGAASLELCTTGQTNVAIGHLALSDLISGAGNVAIGDQSLAAATGDGNVAIGKSSGIVLTSGNDNVLIGKQAMGGLVSGTSNVAIGLQAAQSSTSGDYNTYIGRLVNSASSGGSFNCMIGDVAGLSMTGGSQNTFIGALSGLNLTGGSYNLILGEWFGPSSSISNVIALSDGQQNLRLDYHYTNANTWTSPKAICITPVAVGSLPAAGIQGRRHFVTDATVTTFASVVAGTGGNPVPVYDDGTNWRIG